MSDVVSQPLHATFFTLKPRDRTVLLPATIVFVLITAALIGALIAINWGTFAQIIQLAQAGDKAPTDDAVAMRLVSGIFALFGTVFLFLFPIYLTVAAYEAACLRWMIRGEAPGLFGLTIDNDVWRVYCVYWCWFAGQMAVSTVASTLMFPVMFMTMGDVLAQSPPDPAAMMRWQLSVQLPIMLLQYIPMIFLGVRFAPGAATAIACRQFAFMRAWRVTEGRFWPLLGSFALLWALWMAAALVASAPLLLRIWPLFEDVFVTPTEDGLTNHINAYLSPEGWMLIGLGYGVALIGGLVVALFSYGINARAAMVALEEGKITPVTR